MSADTLAAHSIGGFKVGVGFALRKCRDCLATNETMATKVSNNSQYGKGICHTGGIGKYLCILYICLALFPDSCGGGVVHKCLGAKLT